MKNILLETADLSYGIFEQHGGNI